MSAPHDTPAPAPLKPPAPDCQDMPPHPVTDLSDIAVNLKLASDLSTAPDASLAFAGLADVPTLELASGGAIEVDPGMESSKPAHEPVPLISLGVNLEAEASGDTGAGADGALLASLIGSGTSVIASLLGDGQDDSDAGCDSGDGLAQPLLCGIAAQIDDLLAG